MKFLQDELSQKIFVSRQTISNWENNKNYPDVKSLLLLSSLFNVSLHILIKGDLEEMKGQIKKEDKVPFFGSYVWFYSQINLSQSNFNIFYWNFYIILTSL